MRSFKFCTWISLRVWKKKEGGSRSTFVFLRKNDFVVKVLFTHYRVQISFVFRMTWGKLFKTMRSCKFCTWISLRVWKKKEGGSRSTFVFLRKNDCVVKVLFTYCRVQISFVFWITRGQFLRQCVTAGRSYFGFSMESWEFCIVIILPSALSLCCRLNL